MFSNGDVFRTKDRASDRIQVNLKSEIESNVLQHEETGEEDGDHTVLDERFGLFH